jgi:anti-sigma factor RsiW
MSYCSSIQLKFSEYLDGRLTGHAMQEIAAHLETCGDCEGEWKALKQTKMALAALGPVPQPPDCSEPGTGAKP